MKEEKYLIPKSEINIKKDEPKKTTKYRLNFNNMKVSQIGKEDKINGQTNNSTNKGN